MTETATNGRPVRPLVRLLGPIEVDGTPAPLTSQQRSLVAYLACIGPADRERVVDALWDGRPVSSRRFRNLVSEVRRALGRSHLPDATGGRYRVVGVDTDLDRFQELIGGAGSGGQRQAEDEAVGLSRALALVRGPAVSCAAERHWSWLERHPELAARAEATVADAAHRLSALLRARGDLDGARWACERGLACSPLDRPLMDALEGVYLAQGRPGVAHRLVDAWESRLRNLNGIGSTQVVRRE